MCNSDVFSFSSKKMMILNINAKLFMTNFKMIKCYTLDFFLFLRLVKVNLLVRSLRCQGPWIQQGQLKFEDNSIQGKSQANPLQAAAPSGYKQYWFLYQKKKRKLLHCSSHLIYIHQKPQYKVFIQQLQAMQAEQEGASSQNLKHDNSSEMQAANIQKAHSS